MTRAKLALLLGVVLFVPDEAAPCSVLIGGELLYPSPGEALGLRSAIVFRGGFSTIDALSLTDAEGSEVPIEIDQYSGLYRCRVGGCLADRRIERRQ
jgi:hypothetical protein